MLKEQAVSYTKHVVQRGPYHMYAREYPGEVPNRHQPKPLSPVILSRSEGSPSTGRERLRGPQHDRARPSLSDRSNPRPLPSSSPIHHRAFG